MLFHPMLTPANKCADRGGCGVENVDSILFDDFPEPIGLRPVRRTFIHNNRGAVRERTVDDVTVTGHPPYVSGTPKDIFVADVENVFHGGIHAH